MDLNKSALRNIEWKIHNVTEEGLTDRKRLESSKFEILFDNKVTKWYFSAKSENSQLSVYLWMQEPKATGFLTKFEFFIRTLSNEKDKCYNFLKDSSAFKVGYGCKSLISISELFENSEKYLECGTLTIGAKVKLIKKAPEESDETSKIHCQHVAIFENYFETKSYSDCTFICSDDIKVQAHRFALAANSPVFKEMIEFVETPKGIFRIDDIDSETMTEILRYVYTKEVNNIEDFAPKLIYGAEKYGLDGLKELCASAMIENLSVENAVDYLLLADQYKIKELLDSCIEFIKVNYHLVKNEADWKKLENKHLNMLLEYYNQNPEYALLLESSFF